MKKSQFISSIKKFFEPQLLIRNSAYHIVARMKDKVRRVYGTLESFISDYKIDEKGRKIYIDESSFPIEQYEKSDFTDCDYVYLGSVGLYRVDIYSAEIDIYAYVRGNYYCLKDEERKELDVLFLWIELVFEQGARGRMKAPLGYIDLLPYKMKLKDFSEVKDIPTMNRQPYVVMLHEIAKIMYDSDKSLKDSNMLKPLMDENKTLKEATKEIENDIVFNTIKNQVYEIENINRVLNEEISSYRDNIIKRLKNVESKMLFVHLYQHELTVISKMKQVDYTKDLYAFIEDVVKAFVDIMKEEKEKGTFLFDIFSGHESVVGHALTHYTEHYFENVFYYMTANNGAILKAIKEPKVRKMIETVVKGVKGLIKNVSDDGLHFTFDDTWRKEYIGLFQLLLACMGLGEGLFNFEDRLEMYVGLVNKIYDICKENNIKPVYGIAEIMNNDVLRKELLKVDYIPTVENTNKLDDYKRVGELSNVGFMYSDSIKIQFKKQLMGGWNNMWAIFYSIEDLARKLEQTV